MGHADIFLWTKNYHINSFFLLCGEAMLVEIINVDYINNLIAFEEVFLYSIYFGSP